MYLYTCPYPWYVVQYNRAQVLKPNRKTCGIRAHLKMTHGRPGRGSDLQSFPKAFRTQLNCGPFPWHGIPKRIMTETVDVAEKRTLNPLLQPQNAYDQPAFTSASRSALTNSHAWGFH